MHNAHGILQYIIHVRSGGRQPQRRAAAIGCRGHLRAGPPLPGYAAVGGADNDQGYRMFVMSCQPGCAAVGERLRW